MKTMHQCGKRSQDGLDTETTERHQFLKRVRDNTGRAVATAPAVAMLLATTSKMAAAAGGGCGCAVAEANGPYKYDANTTTISVDSTDSSGDTYEWTTGDGTIFNTASPSIDIEDSGLTMTTDMKAYTLRVWEGSEGPASDTANVSYTNAAPTISNASGDRNPDGSVAFSAAYIDDDLGINSLISDFEMLLFEFDTSMATSAAQVGDGFLNMAGTVDYLILSSLFGSDGMYTAYANVADKAGGYDSFGFTINVSAPPATVPVPAAVWLFGSGLAGLGFSARRRRKQAG